MTNLNKKTVLLNKRSNKSLPTESKHKKVDTDATTTPPLANTTSGNVKPTDPIYLDVRQNEGINGGLPKPGIMSIAFCIDGQTHLWMPHAKPFAPSRAGKESLNETEKIQIHIGLSMPQSLAKAIVTGRKLCSCNVEAIRPLLPDKERWPPPEKWIDLLYLCRAAALDDELTSYLVQGEDISDQELETGEIRVLRGLSPGFARNSQEHQRLVAKSVAGLQKCSEAYEKLQPYLESQILETNARINERGVLIDVKFIEMLIQTKEKWQKRLVSLAEEATKGKLRGSDLRSAKKLCDWLSANGICLTDLKKLTVQNYIADSCLDHRVRAVLETYLALMDTNSSTLRSALREVSPDGRLRNKLKYFGAHTGRWTCSRFPLQGLPQPRYEDGDVKALVDVLPDIDRCLERLPKNLTFDDAISGLERRCIVPEDGKRFLILDFTSIEPICLAWLAGEESMLNKFVKGTDIYSEFGYTLFQSTANEVRAAAKEILIKCLYGIGGDSLEEELVPLQSLGLRLSAEKIIEVYRTTFSRIYDLGQDFESAFRNAILCNKPLRVGKCVIRATPEGDVVVVLPSKRKLIFRKVRVEGYNVTFFHPEGERRTLYASSILQNITQAVCRDIFAEAMRNLDAHGREIVMHVHDEVVIEVYHEACQGTLEQALMIMSQSPAWAGELPLQVRGIVSESYLVLAEAKEKALHARSGKLLTGRKPR